MLVHAGGMLGVDGREWLTGKGYLWSQGANLCYIVSNAAPDVSPPRLAPLNHSLKHLGFTSPHA